MKTISGRILSSKPISLSKAASSLSSFLSTDNGASQPICAYLRRASVSFNELKQLHKDLRVSRKHRNHHKSEIVSENEKSPSRKKRGQIDTKSDLNNGGTGNFEDVIAEDGKTKGELKIGIDDDSVRRVDLDKGSSDRDKMKRKKHKKKSEDGIGNDRVAGAVESDGRLRDCDDNGVGYGVGGNEMIKIESFEMGQRSSSVIENNVAIGKNIKKYEDKMDVYDKKGKVKGDGERRRENEAATGNDDVELRVEVPTKKKKKKREQDVGYLQNDEGGAMVKEGMEVLGSGGSKKREAKKRKIRDTIEGEDYGSVEQQGIKKRKGNE